MSILSRDPWIFDKLPHIKLEYELARLPVLERLKLSQRIIEWTMMKLYISAFRNGWPNEAVSLMKQCQVSTYAKVIMRPAS